ncbi:hypothetical protein [Roseomonas sp. BN140053]|uniref:hypothetical protein n=1 Tax=Roseomonas sp. BN140053 TaxID=3391898 RepID=UPI0039E8AB3F
MRRPLLPLLAALLLFAAPAARAALTPAELAAVELAPPPGAALPPALPLVDATGRAATPAQAMAGRPAVLVLADFTCVTLCGTALAMAAASLEETRLRPGADYHLLVLGLDPRDGPAEAAAMRGAQLGRSPLAAAAVFLTGDAATLEAAQAAIGYRARYDAEHDQYAHPLGALVLTADGRVSRVLGGLQLDPDALRLALVEASAGTLGSLGERLRLLCYGFDPAHGVLNGLVKRALAAGTLVTLLALGAFLLLLSRRRERRA